MKSLSEKLALLNDGVLAVAVDEALVVDRNAQVHREGFKELRHL